MKTKTTKFLIVILCLFSQAVNLAAQFDPPKKIQGFLGTYHPFNGTAYNGNGWTEGESLQKAFNFGENAIISQAAYNGYTFAENIENNCEKWNVNKLYGILRPPTEKGAINQPKDTDLLKPFMTEPGMIQGAKRFSEISKRCPQLSGVIIDDFFNDYPKLLSAENLRDIKDALSGKSVDENGNFDHSSKPSTPDLKLYIVVYEHQLDKKPEKEVFDAVDGISLWIWKQSEHYQNFDSYIETLRRNYPNKEIITGVYVYNGVQTPTAASVHYVIERATDLYAKGETNGLLIFSAVWMSREKSTRERWRELDLPIFLGRVYYPFLGEGAGRVLDAKTKKPIAGALVSVTRFADGKSLLVARKFTDERGEYRFGGWAKKNERASVNYQIKIESVSFKPRLMPVKLRAGEIVRFADARLKR